MIPSHERQSHEQANMEPTATPYQLSPLGRKWASKRRQNVLPTKLKEMLSEQGERCALSGAPLLFDKDEGTPHKGGKGVHPLYPAVDHIECGNVERGCQVVCEFAARLLNLT
jgi:hypothetical protein